jgi:hypothetical protein
VKFSAALCDLFQRRRDKQEMRAAFDRPRSGSREVRRQLLLLKVAPKGVNVPRAEVARRRRRNKVARASRKANR